MKLLIFDIDGTLLLTGGAGRVAFERIFEELFGVENAWQGLKPDGKTDPLIISELASQSLGRVLSNDEYDLVCSKYEQYFTDELPKSERFRKMPGVESLLSSLTEIENVALGLATGNFEDAAWKKLKHAEFEDYFQFGGFGSDSKDRLHLTKLAIERGREFVSKDVPGDQIFVIGDTIHDISAGQRAGAKTIGVATGSTPRSDLEAAQADWVFEDFSDSEAFLKCLRL